MRIVLQVGYVHHKRVHVVPVQRIPQRSEPAEVGAVQSVDQLLDLLVAKIVIAK